MVAWKSKDETPRLNMGHCRDRNTPDLEIGFTPGSACSGHCPPVTPPLPGEHANNEISSEKGQPEKGKESSTAVGRSGVKTALIMFALCVGLS